MGREGGLLDFCGVFVCARVWHSVSLSFGLVVSLSGCVSVTNFIDLSMSSVSLPACLTLSMYLSNPCGKSWLAASSSCLLTWCAYFFTRATVLVALSF